MKNDLVLVVGGNGTVGRELVRLLKEAGVATRITTSKKTHLNSTGEVAHLDLTTGEGIAAAFDGVERAFFLSPPGYADQYALISPLIQEAKRRGLKKVVLMTAMGADASDETPFRRAELELERSGLNYNIIRPNWFLQNFNTFWLQGIKSEDQIALPAGTAKVSFIDARDIARVAAKLLMTSSFDRQAFDLTGPEAVDHKEVADRISEAVGRKISYHDVTPDSLKKTLLGAGLPAGYVEFLLMIFGFLKEGYNARLTTAVQDITGVRAGSLAQYVKDHENFWIK